eukprot:8977837-Heterocapsa_arctica.AAC.1
MKSPLRVSRPSISPDSVRSLENHIIPDGSSNNIFPVNLVKCKKVSTGVEPNPQEVLVGRGPTHKRKNNRTEGIMSKVITPYCLAAEPAVCGTIV